MVDRTFLQQVKTGATIINTSRGGVVDEKALGEEIWQKKLSEVILDVFEEEPGVNPDLLQMISLATPHIAGYSLDGKANGTTMAVRSVSRYFGLDLDQWEPGSLPDPEPREILVDASGKDPLEVLWEVYRQTYDVSADDRRFRADPSAFEKLRGNYPPRREPPAYSVRLFQGYQEIISMLEGLGFSVLSDFCA
jgi:erythronate-4-phosphate dehydrogenase